MAISRKQGKGTSNKSTRVMEGDHVLTSDNRLIPLLIQVGMMAVSFFETGNKAAGKSGRIGFHIIQVLRTKSDGTPETWKPSVEFRWTDVGQNETHIDFIGQLLSGFDPECCSDNSDTQWEALTRILDPCNEELGLSGDDLENAKALSDEVYSKLPLVGDLANAVEQGTHTRDTFNQYREVMLATNADNLGDKQDEYHSQKSIAQHVAAREKAKAYHAEVAKQVEFDNVDKVAC